MKSNKRKNKIERELALLAVPTRSSLALLTLSGEVSLSLSLS